MSEIHESTGSYALNALDPAELPDFERHLATCESCQDEVAEFCETAAELSLLSMATPPAGLRASILEAIQGLPQLPATTTDEDDRTTERPVVPLPAARSRPGDGPRRALPGSEVADEPDPSPVDELALRRQRRRNRVLSGLVAAMLALAVGLGGVVYTLVQERQTQIASQTLEEQLIRAEDAVVVNEPLTGGGRATFIVSKALDRALFLGTDLPDPGPGLRYQLWTGTGNPSSLDTITGIFADNPVNGGGGDKREFLNGDVDRAEFMAISIEQDNSIPESPNTDQIVGAAVLPT